MRGADRVQDLPPRPSSADAGRDYIAAFLAHLVNWDFANHNLAHASGACARIAGESKARSVAS